MNTIERQKELQAKRREELQEEFEHLVEIFGIGSRTWDEMHTTFSWNYFCPANEKSFIAEYLLLEDFVRRAKLCGCIYYQFIDDFLAIYHDAVYSRLNLTK